MIMNRRTIVTAACAVSLAIPCALGAQTDTTRRDTTRMRDTTRRMQDTTRRMQDTTRRMRDTTANRAGQRTNTSTQAQPPRTTTPRATSDQRLRVQKGGGTGEAAGTLDTRPLDTRGTTGARGAAGTGAAGARRGAAAAADSARAQAQADSLATIERARTDSMNLVMQRQRDSVAAVERVRADSVATVERRRADSLAVIETARRDSMARVDSIAREEEARRQYMSRYRFGGTGWYVGLGGGTAAPTGNFEQLGYNSGFNVNVPIGWQRENRALGFRMDLNYATFSGRQFLGIGDNSSQVRLQNASPKVLSATFNLTAALPLSFIRNVSLYGVGGGGLYHFRSIGNTSALGGYLGNDVLSVNSANNQVTRNKFGAQVGAGLDWTVGTSAVYIESRLENVFADQDDNVQFRDFVGSSRANTLRWVPIVIGVKVR